MKAVIQRVEKAEVTIQNDVVGKIGAGLLVFLGIENGDNEENAIRLIKRIIHLRIFSDQYKESNISVMDQKGEILIVSQFTLCANMDKGHRPSYIGAASPDQAEKLYKFFCLKLKDLSGLNIQEGRFGAMMKVALINNGPATFILNES